LLRKPLFGLQKRRKQPERYTKCQLTLVGKYCIKNWGLKMQLKKYNHPVLFYGIAIFVPWLSWFILAWLSHTQWFENPTVVFWGSILGIIGLCGPFAIAMILILPDKEMRRELFSQIFNFKGIRPVFWILSFVLFPVSILSAQAISLLFGHSISQFKIVEHMSFSAGIFPAWFLLVIAPILEEFGWIHTAFTV
jgi:hypothetical protein